MSPLLSARTVLCLLALLSSFSGGAGWAQDAAVLPGSRVRVWTGLNDNGRATGPGTTGQLTAWTADSIVLDRTGARGPWATPITSVHQVDVSRGQANRRHAALRMGGIGWIVGLVTGAVLYYNEDDDFLPPVLSAVAKGAPIGAAGGIGGVIIGALSPRERWQRVPLPGR